MEVIITGKGPVQDYGPTPCTREEVWQALSLSSPEGLDNGQLGIGAEWALERMWGGGGERKLFLAKLLKESRQILFIRAKVQKTEIYKSRKIETVLINHKMNCGVWSRRQARHILTEVKPTQVWEEICRLCIQFSFLFFFLFQVSLTLTLVHIIHIILIHII